jgi:hypothetical protein
MLESTLSTQRTLMAPSQDFYDPSVFTDLQGHKGRTFRVGWPGFADSLTVGSPFSYFILEALLESSNSQISFEISAIV